MKKQLTALIIFGIAFGFVEAAVVYYLRGLLGYSSNYPLADHHSILNLGIINFVTPKASLLGNTQITKVEVVREASTIIMLASVAFLSARRFNQQLGAFLIAFSLWDLFYYIFLKFLTGWPTSLYSTDVYFLIPVTWIGPVITPIIIFVILFFVGIKLYARKV